MKYLVVSTIALISGHFTIYCLNKFWDCNLRLLTLYPIIELVTLLVYLAIVHLTGIGISSIFYCLLFSTLVIITFTDLKHYLIPNSVVLTMFILGLTFHLLIQPFSIYNAFFSFLFSGLFFLSLQALSRGGLGGGDIKLIAVLGLWFGFPKITLIIFISALLGSLVGLALILTKFKTREQALAFGPFIVLATFLVFLVGDKIWIFYLKGF